MRRFGQTFLLDIVKTEQTDGDDDHQIQYIRPAISDDDVLVVTDTNPSVSEYISRKLSQYNSIV